MADQFELQKRLGSGYFGEVWLANETALGRQVALKIIDRAKVLDANNLFAEAKLLAAARHPNVVDVVEAGHFGSNQIYISMEYLKKGSLDDEASGGYVDLSRVKRVMVDLLRGLSHLHSKSIVHRDIKPANILIGSGSEAKLSDFGLARTMSKAVKELGVKDYNHTRHLAPEVWLGGNHTIRSDIYAAGMTLYRLINGDAYLPTVADIRSEILAGTYPDRERNRAFVTRPLKAIIKKSLSVSPSDRFDSADAMRTAIEKAVTEMNWHESIGASGVEWSGTRRDRCYYVKLKMKGKSADLEVTHGTNKHSQRKIKDHCLSDVPLEKANKAAARTLQNFVLGRL